MQAQKLAIAQPTLDAKYVKRKELKKYLPANILKIETKKRSDQGVTKLSPQQTSSTTVLTSPDSSMSVSDVVSPESIKNLGDLKEATDESSQIQTNLEAPSVKLLKNESKDNFILFEDTSDLKSRKLNISNSTTSLNNNNNKNSNTKLGILSLNIEYYFGFFDSFLKFLFRLNKNI